LKRGQFSVGSLELRVGSWGPGVGSAETLKPV